MHRTDFPISLAELSAAPSNPARIPMIAITTNNSINVKAGAQPR
jgi:hypothetical protein